VALIDHDDIHGTDYEAVAGATKAMEAAVYDALNAVDRYSNLITSLLERHEASSQPNMALVKRYRQFLQRADNMTTALEDDVLDELLFCLHRLFAVDLAERDEFI